MFKFFYKYNKIILAVGGSILMVLFLLPSATNLFQPGRDDMSVGTLGGRDLTLADVDRADAEVQLLTDLGLQVPVGRENTGVHWLLMLEEARRQGLYGSRAASEQIIDQFQVSPARLNAVHKRYRITDETLYASLNHYGMVLQLWNLTMGQSRISEPRVRHLARDLISTVTVRVLAVPADLLAEDMETPADEQLQKHFETNRADIPGSSKPYGFGYRLPDAVKLEYLRFPLERIKESIQITDVDANDYYLNHPGQFLPEPEETEDESADASPTPDPTKPLPYTEVRAKAFELATTEKAEALRERMVKFASGLLGEKEMKLPRDGETGYLKLPGGFLPYELEVVAEAVQKEFGVLPDIERYDEKWLKVPQGITGMPDIGDATLTVGSGSAAQSYPLWYYLASVRELNPATDHPLLSLRLQTKAAGRPITDASGDGYIVRVLDAEPSGVPASLDQVRETVIRDAKQLAAYNKLAESMGDWLSAAQRDGLDALAKNRSERYETGMSPMAIRPFQRRTIDYQSGRILVPSLPRIGQSELFVDRVFEQAKSLDKIGDPASESDEAYFVVSLDSQLTHYIIHLKNYKAPTRQEYEQMKFIAGILIQRMEAAQAMTGAHPFSMEALAKRVGYVTLEHEQTEGKNDKEDEPAA